MANAVQARPKVREAAAVPAGWKKIYLRSGQKEPEGREIFKTEAGARYYLIEDKAAEPQADQPAAERPRRGRRPRASVQAGAPEAQDEAEPAVADAALPSPEAARMSDGEIQDLAIGMAANLKPAAPEDRERVLALMGKLVAHL